MDIVVWMEFTLLFPLSYLLSHDDFPFNQMVGRFENVRQGKGWYDGGVRES
jgi:hypothetical protein